jgi:hypothetical protein
MTLRVTGGPELRARLSAISAPFREIGGDWQLKASRQMRSTAPSRTGHLRNSIVPKHLTDKFASVWGDYWAMFIDRGTKAHDITPRAKRGPNAALKFEYRGETIFARKVHHRRTARRPFVTVAAREALRGWSDSLIGLWNRKRETQRWRKG